MAEWNVWLVGHVNKVPWHKTNLGVHGFSLCRCISKDMWGHWMWMVRTMTWSRCTGTLPLSTALMESSMCSVPFSLSNIIFYIFYPNWVGYNYFYPSILKMCCTISLIMLERTCMSHALIESLRIRKMVQYIFLNYTRKSKKVY